MVKHTVPRPQQSNPRGKKRAAWTVVDEEAVEVKNARGVSVWTTRKVKQTLPSPSKLRRTTTPSHSRLHTPPNADRTPYGDDGDDRRSEKPKKTRKKSQNDFLREWQPLRSRYLEELLSMEQLPTEACHCGQTERLIRCSDCFSTGVSCRTCCLEFHKYLPFHRLQQWNGNFFKASSLYAQGHVVYVGHGGKPCPSNSSALFDINTDTLVDNIDLNWVEDDEDMKAACEDDEVEVDIHEDVLVIVHTTGVFQHRIRWCRCPGCPEKHIQLLRMNLFSCSISKPSTAFTFDVLDHFYADSMECKTAGKSFYEKIRRLTNNAFPHMVPTRDKELLRISRQWRNLQTLKRFGFGHETGKSPGIGQLALFCAACPQPGINLPADWKNDPEQEKYFRVLVIDGNFKGDHVRMKYPTDDVKLSSGEGYMVEPTRYLEHISVTKEVKQKSTECHNHRALSGANLKGKNLDATGIGAVACARHGCFVPGSVVDFQKGERYMNIDYAVCQALLLYASGLLGVILLYDVACKWFIHFIERVEEGPYLDIPDFWKIIFAVGKFHLSAHVKRCFELFSPNFIKGIGQVDGEILETLWSSFNHTARYARTMSGAHRQEVYDDHMRNANWKKLVGIVKTLLLKSKKAAIGRREAKVAYDGLTESLDENLIKKWRAQEGKAMKERGEHLRIFQVHEDKVPSQSDVRLKLTTREGVAGLEVGSITWLINGLAIEELQDSVRVDVRMMTPLRSASDKTTIENRRRQLEKRIKSFHKQAGIILGDVELDDLSPHEDDHSAQENDEDWDGVDDWVDGSEGEEEREEETVAGEVPDTSRKGKNVDDSDTGRPERIALCLPSSLGKVRVDMLGLKNLASEEMELRQGQANDALAALRIELGHKALLFRTDVRQSKTTKGKTRAWSGIRKSSMEIRKHVRSYRRARKALQDLGADADILEKYREIEDKDLMMSSDMLEENRFGQRNDALAWFWRLGPQSDSRGDDWMEEFYRVNWLRAKARFDRWDEEQKMVQSEMKWTILYFVHQQEVWQKRAGNCEGDEKQGHRAYALKQAEVWRMFATEGKRNFEGLMTE